MAVEAVVSVVIQKVTDLLIEDAIIFDKVIDQVEEIRLELRRMRGFLTAAEERQKSDSKAKKWVREYLKTVYCVEDDVESYVLRLACKKRQMGFFQNYGFFIHDLRSCRNLRRKMKDIEKKIKDLHKRKPVDVEDASLRSNSLGQEENQLQLEFDKLEDNYDDMNLNRISSSRETETKTKRTPSSCCEEEDSDFVGFEEYMEELVNQLTKKNSSKIIPVIGPPGSGRTTLVRRVYKRKSIKAQFEFRAWLDISEEHAFKDVLLRIWNQVNKKRNNNNREHIVPDEGQLGKKLSEWLQGHKCLIVLDEARNIPEAWKQLRKAFQDMGNGSKVVVITREEEENLEPICVKPLGDNKSWELFLTKLCLELEGEKENSLIHNTTLQHEILNKCKGLPRNILLLGGILSTKKVSYGEWARFFNHANWCTSEIWLLSYNDLPVHYKLCLLYLGLFPKEFDVPVRRILRLWLAEGFLRRSTGPSEDLAEKCLNYLANRNLIKITKFRSDGVPKACHLPGFLREHLSPMAQEISLFHIHHKKAELSIPSTVPGVRRIVEYAPADSKSINVDNLRSYLSFNFPRYDAPAKEVGIFLSKIIGNKGFGLLRVLDLEGVYKPTLPPTLKHLFQLRYLGLRWTFLDILPESVGDLPYLETLDLKRTYINKLPSSVWKLKHLRHLNLPDVRVDMRMLQPSSQLLTLWGLSINDDSNMENGLGRLADLRELGITCQLEQFDKLMNWITNLTHLQSLSLTSKDNMGRPSNFGLQALSELGNLSHLKVLGKLSHLLTKDEFPPYLKVLTLSVSHLTEDPMWTLSHLRCLSVLRLLAKSYLGPKMHCPQTGFRQLGTLKLWMLEELEEWIVERGGMPQIRELNVRHCHKLKRLPLELLNRTTLEELVLDDMLDEFEQHTRKTKSRHTVLTVNKYKFSSLPWEKDADLWH